MQSHLESFVAVLIVHVVDAVQRVNIQVCQPTHHIFVLIHYIIIIEVIAFNRSILRAYLIVLASLCINSFVLTAIDCIQQALCEVCSCTEELHVLTNSHGRYAASDCIVIAVSNSHQVIVFILERRSVDGELCTVSLERSRQTLRPQNGQVRFWSSAQVFQGVQVTEAGLCNHGSAVNTHTADGFGNPLRVAGEQCIVFRCSCELYHTQLHDEVVDKFLSLFFCQDALLHISFNININESRSTAKAHCSTVLILNSTQITEVQPLDSFLSVGSRLGNIESIPLSHSLQSLQSLYLFCEFFSQTDDFFCHGTASNCLLMFLVFDQLVNTIQCNSTIVTDDTATTVSIRQTGDDCIVSCRTHFRCVNIEYAFVMSLPVMLKDVADFRIYFIAISLASFFCHTDTTERLQRTLQRLVSLEAYDGFLVLIQITCFVGIYSRYNLCIHVQHAAIFPFFLEQVQNLVPQFGCCSSRASQKAFVAFIRCVVLLNEVQYIYVGSPCSADEAFPFLLHCFCHDLNLSFAIFQQFY